MKTIFSTIAHHSGLHDANRLEKQIRDYIDVGMSLVWQRQATFLAATLLSAFYFDVQVAFGCYGLVLLSEVYDSRIWKRILRHKNWTLQDGRRFMWQLLGSTFFSAFTICLFVILMAAQAGATAYFTPLFFLFAAGIFAAVNNHQLLPVLILRLLMYGLSFLYIPLKDILISHPPIHDILWLQLFTAIFVMYFIIDCSFIFLKLYRRNLNQMRTLKVEHERTKVAYKAKSEFLSTVSHELRTPLTSIKGSLQLVASGALESNPEKRQNLLKIAEQNSARLTGLIEDILDLQSLESPDHKLDLQEIEVNELLEHLGALHEARAAEAGLELTVLPTDETITIAADQNRILQLMENLITNAVKFSEAGTSIKLSALRRDGFAQLAVADQGIGISEDVADKIFEKFTQLDGSDTRKVGGVGLGLSIAKLIATQHGGDIRYESSPGEGTTFYVKIPLAAAAELAA